MTRALSICIYISSLSSVFSSVPSLFFLFHLLRSLLQEPQLSLHSPSALHVCHLFPLWTPLHSEGNGNPLQCSCLENPRDGGAWWAAVYGVAQSRTRLKRLSSSSSSSSSIVAKSFSTFHCGPFMLFSVPLLSEGIGYLDKMC